MFAGVENATHFPCLLLCLFLLFPWLINLPVFRCTNVNIIAPAPQVAIVTFVVTVLLCYLRQHVHPHAGHFAMVTFTSKGPISSTLVEFYSTAGSDVQLMYSEDEGMSTCIKGALPAWQKAKYTAHRNVSKITNHQFHLSLGATFDSIVNSSPCMKINFVTYRRCRNSAT